MNAKEQLLSIKRQRIEAEIDSHKYLIIEMNGKEREDYETSLLKYVKGEVIYNTINSVSRLIAYSLHDENGDRIFDYIKDLALVNSMPSSVIKKLFDACAKINKVDELVDQEKNL